MASTGITAQVKAWAPAAVGLLALAAVVAWLSTGSSPEGGGGQRPPYVLPVTLAPVLQRRVQPTLRLTGTVRPARGTLLAFEVAGVVSSVEILAGDPVKAGQVVARLDARDLHLRVLSAEANLLLAERALKELQAGVRAEERQRLSAEVRIAEAGETLARLELERARTLLEQDAISQGQLDEREANLAVAQGRLAASKALLATATAGPRLEDVEVARARVSQAQSALEIAKREASKALLLAPWAGRLQRHGVSAGAFVESGDMISVLIDDRHLEVEVEIPSRFAHRLGDHAGVRLTSDQDPDLLIETRLDTRLPAANETSRNVTGVVRLWRRPDGSLDSTRHPTLQPGMFVRVELSLTPLVDPLVVPPDSIRITKGGPVLVRAAKGEEGKLVAEWIPVRILGTDPKGTAVTSLGSPLSLGDQVVLTGVDLAFPGVPLLPRAPDAPGGEPPAPGSGESASAKSGQGS